MKNLSLRYSITQISYWATSSGATAFATAYLMQKGVSSSVVGTLLALAGLFSCLSQALFASYADRSEHFTLTKTLILMSVVSCICLSLQFVSAIPIMFSAVLYMLGLWSCDSMVPLLNALCVAYNESGFFINYGKARGVGSAATALSSLLVGLIIAKFGTTWMILFLLLLRVGYTITLFGYPKIYKSFSAYHKSTKSCSILSFIFRYPWYCASLMGIAFLGMFHAMTENYLIAIISPLGGNSSHVGIALFISAILASPVIFCFSKIRSLLSDITLIKIAAVSFLTKAVLFYFAKDITDIFLIQLLQATSYAFLHPAQLYYAESKVHRTDMVKGQAFITAAYALGCSSGNFAGGQLLMFGVEAVLIFGILIAMSGTAIIFFTATKNDTISPTEITSHIN